MVCKSDSESIVKLQRMYFKEISFWRTDADFDTANLNLQFSKAYHFNDCHNECTVELGCKIKDDDGQLVQVSATITGTFTCEYDDEEIRDRLLRKNTLAILFPYLRSQISLITAQPNMAPMVLPPINIEALFDSIEESST